MSPRHRLGTALGCVLAATLSVARPVSAEFSAAPYALARFAVNDNKRLKARDGSGVFESKTTLGSRLNYERPEWNAQVVPEFSLLRHSSHRELDNEDYGVEADVARDFERQRFEFGVDFDRTLSSTVELTEAGQIDAAVPRTTVGFDGAWTRMFGERFSSTVFGSFSDITLDAAPDSQLFDYRLASGGLALNYQYSPRTAWLATLAVQDFSLPDLDSGTTSYSYRFGFESALTDTVDGRFTFGHNVDVNRFESDELVFEPGPPPRFTVQRDTETVRNGGELISAEIEKRFSDGLWSVNWDRQFTPSSLGARLRVESVRTRLIWRFDHRTRLVTVVEYRDQAREGAADNESRPQERVMTSANLFYRIDANWTLSPRYRYIRRWSPVGGSTADANEIAIELRFTGDRLTWFR